MSGMRTKNWVDILPEIEKGHNNKVNKTTGVSPNNVNYQNAYDIFKKKYPWMVNDRSKYVNMGQPVFKVGDTVTIKLPKTQFQHGFLPTNSSEVYVVMQILYRSVIRYRLRTSGEEMEVISGTFRQEQLTLVSIPQRPDGKAALLSSKQRDNS